MRYRDSRAAHPPAPRPALTSGLRGAAPRALRAALWGRGPSGSVLRQRLRSDRVDLLQIVRREVVVVPEGVFRRRRPDPRRPLGAFAGREAVPQRGGRSGAPRPARPAQRGTAPFPRPERRLRGHAESRPAPRRPAAPSAGNPRAEPRPIGGGRPSSPANGRTRLRRPPRVNPGARATPPDASAPAIGRRVSRCEQLADWTARRESDGRGRWERSSPQRVGGGSDVTLMPGDVIPRHSPLGPAAARSLCEKILYTAVPNHLFLPFGEVSQLSAVGTSRKGALKHRMHTWIALLVEPLSLDKWDLYSDPQ